MTKNLSVFLVGMLFSLGLSVSGLTDPAKVLAFLDLSGAWDPSLIFTMGGGLVVASAFYLAAKRRQASAFGEAIRIPSNTTIDLRLIVGSAIFGVGWGLAGLCPGPALVNLGFFSVDAAIFVAAMLAGMALYAQVDQRRMERRMPIDA